MIDKFKKENFFLSNFYEAPIVFDGIIYDCSEAAFQAQKTLDIETRKLMSSVGPGKAKQMGRSVSLRPDWDDIKDDIMYQICKEKFTQHPDLRQKLIATGDEELIEGNWWKDTYWGVCDGIGENKLGKILMKLRTELRNN